MIFHAEGTQTGLNLLGNRDFVASKYSDAFPHIPRDEDRVVFLLDVFGNYSLRTGPTRGTGGNYRTKGEFAWLPPFTMGTR